MKKILFIVMSSLALASCAPVLSRDLMKEGAREFQMYHLLETPEVFKDKLFILGGLIVDTKLSEKGSEVEAVFAPVDSYGYLKDSARYEGRFIAVYPRSKGLLDPMIYKRGRQITLAGEFLEVRKGKIDEMEYVWPVFVIRQIYLWDEYRDYGGMYYYPYPYWSPWCYDAFGRPFHCPHFWGPWPGWW
jgi:outer membrane lipoprotein